jgi:hypothetical protein
MTNINRDALVESYINAMIDSMTLEEIQEMLYVMIESDLEDVSDEQLICEISDCYPELLGAS